MPLKDIAEAAMRHLLTRSFRARGFELPDIVKRAEFSGSLVLATDGFWAELSENDQARFLGGTKPRQRRTATIEASCCCAFPSAITSRSSCTISPQKISIDDPLMETGIADAQQISTPRRESNRRCQSWKICWKFEGGYSPTFVTSWMFTRERFYCRYTTVNPISMSSDFRKPRTFLRLDGSCSSTKTEGSQSEEARTTARRDRRPVCWFPRRVYQFFRVPGPARGVTPLTGSVLRGNQQHDLLLLVAERRESAEGLASDFARLRADAIRPKARKVGRRIARSTFDA